MSIEEICSEIYKLQRKDPWVQTPHNCRYAAEEMMRVAIEADQTPPHVEVDILVYPKASPNEGVHYAVKAGPLVFNSVRTAGFPLYFGPLKNAPGLIPHMKVTEKVI